MEAGAGARGQYQRGQSPQIEVQETLHLTGGEIWAHHLVPGSFSEEQDPHCRPQLYDGERPLKFPAPEVGRRDLGGWNWSWCGAEGEIGPPLACLGGAVVVGALSPVTCSSSL